MKRLRIPLAVAAVLFLGAVILRLAEAPFPLKTIWMYGGSAVGAVSAGWG